MLGSILVPLDGSASAEQALDPAIMIARRSGGCVTLCRVLGPVGPGIVGATIEDHTAVLSHAEVYMGVHARRLGQQLGRPVSSRIEEGPPVTVLAHVAHGIDADLIVLTTHGYGGLAHAWVGGTAEGLTRHAGTPLLMLRPSPQGRARVVDFSRILVTLDGSATAEEVLDSALGFAQLFGAQLQLLFVIELPVELPAPPTEDPIRLSGVEDPADQRVRARDYIDRVADRLRAAGVSVEVEIREAVGPATAVLQAAAEFDADIIAMATHGRTRLRRMAVGSVSEQVIRAAGIPVLLVPSREVNVNRTERRSVAAAVNAWRRSQVREA